jgi:uncharacterized membrane protein SpoIIM required for sporulation
LEELIDRSTRLGFRSLGRSELQEMGLLYRQIAADLAALRQDRGSVHFARYLNQLLARAHNIIYSTPKASPSAILRFFTVTYPSVFRRNLRFVQIAVLIFAVAAGVGAALTFQDPDFKLNILGPQMVQTIEKREMWTHSIVGIKPLASSAIMTNNLSVAFMTFALGITAGLGTIYMLFFNGLLMGVIGMACHLSGMSIKLWEFVAPHGVLELPAIFLAGGILIVAGIIEGFVSPTGLARGLKFAMAGALFLLLLTYLFNPGSSPTTTDSSV